MHEVYLKVQQFSAVTVVLLAFQFFGLGFTVLYLYANYLD